MTKKISVIIPVYNGEKYLVRCLDSVINQKNFDLKDLQVLLINDGSVDDSLAILNQYQISYPNIVEVVNRKNAGVAQARNNGIDLSLGEYIVFMDQDDYIDPDYCETFYDAAVQLRSDVVVGGYRRPNEKGDVVRIVAQSDTEYSKKYKISAAWAKIHRTDFLQRNKLRFYDNNYGEDILFTMNENNKTDKVDSINYIGYNWYWNTESVSNTDQRGLRSDIKILGLLTDMIPNIKNALDEYFVIQTGVHYLLFSGRNASRSDFMKLYVDMFEVFDHFKIAYGRNEYTLAGPRGALPITRIAIGVFVMLHRLRLIGVFAIIYCRGVARVESRPMK